MNKSSFCIKLIRYRYRLKRWYVVARSSAWVLLSKICILFSRSLYMDKAN